MSGTLLAVLLVVSDLTLRMCPALTDVPIEAAELAKMLLIPGPGWVWAVER